MKLRSLIIAMALLIISLAVATAQTFITNGLVAYYPFNGNANDASGNGNNPNNIQATLCADRFGIANSAYTFNGINNFIGFASVPMNQVDNWTMTAWVKPASTNQDQTIAVALGFDNGNTGNGYSLGIYLGQLRAVFGGVGDIIGGFAFLSTNQWYQVIMSRKSGTTSFYVNGMVAPGSTTATPQTPTAFT
ncbi:MAG TPA: LamG-like jellyroll fold domain-containing protein, partial [Verrucomicrobiae bacterium]|nr:LamG-like jellyroll fold domain-containing protein [Verrucomicrobiae bacterium]